MKIEKFFKLTIGDTSLELTTKKLRDIATMNIKPTYTFLIDEKTFTLSEQDYKTLKTNASTILDIVPKPRKSTSKYLPETIRAIFDGLTDEWSTIQNVIDSCELKYTTVCSVLRQLHKDGKIVKRRDPDRMNAIQYKLKTRDYVPEHNEVEKIETSDESFDFSTLEDDKRKRMIAQRER